MSCFFCLEGVNTSGVGAHELRGCVLGHLLWNRILLLLVLTLNQPLQSSCAVMDIFCSDKTCISEATYFLRHNVESDQLDFTEA